MSASVTPRDGEREMETPDKEAMIGPAYLSLFLKRDDKTLTIDDRYLKAL